MRRILQAKHSKFVLRNFAIENNNRSPYKFGGTPSSSSNSTRLLTKEDFIRRSKARKKDFDDVHAMRIAEALGIDRDEEINFSKDVRLNLENIRDAKTLQIDNLNVLNIENEAKFNLIPKLAHNLEVIVKKPGIYTMDEIGKLSPDGGEYLRYLPDPFSLNTNNIPPYIPPSKDTLLHKFAVDSRVKYIMSTSTISSILSHLFYAFTNFKAPNFDNISESYDSEPQNFMISQRKPSSSIIKCVDQKNEIYSIDNDPGLYYYKNLILMEMGKVAERFLTMTPTEFHRAFRTDQDNAIDDDYHRFLKVNNDICMRSQIDTVAYDENGKPFVFEIKTRAACPLRYDFQNYEDYLDYKIIEYKGVHSSFEREYYDLIRGAFLKYGFQLKIGRMDGAFIAYHNTKEIFGFEYVKTREIMRRMFGSEIASDAIFLICSRLCTEILDYIIEDSKAMGFKMLKIGFYANSFEKKIYIMSEVYKEEEDLHNQLISPTGDFKDEVEYFRRIKKLNNPVYKYICKIHPFKNGILQSSPLDGFSPLDQYEVKYQMLGLGRVSIPEYMDFLHEAYKFENLNASHKYTGTWVNTNRPNF